MLIVYSYHRAKNIASTYTLPARCLLSVIKFVCNFKLCRHAMFQPIRLHQIQPSQFTLHPIANQYGYIKLSRPNLHFIRSPTNTATPNSAVSIYTSSDRQPIWLHQIEPSQFTLLPIANQYGYTKLSRLNLHFIRSPTNMATPN